VQVVGVWRCTCVGRCGHTYSVLWVYVCMGVCMHVCECVLGMICMLQHLHYKDTKQMCCLQAWYLCDAMWACAQVSACMHACRLVHVLHAYKYCMCAGVPLCRCYMVMHQHTCACKSAVVVIVHVCCVCVSTRLRPASNPWHTFICFNNNSKACFPIPSAKGWQVNCSSLPLHRIHSTTAVDEWWTLSQFLQPTQY